MRGAIAIAAVSALLGGCSRDGAGAGQTVPTEPRTAYVRAMQGGDPATRTVIGGDKLDRTFWSERDTIGVYWTQSGAEGALTGVPFHCYRIYADEALFAADVPAMEEDTYLYYGAYPVPEQVSGTQVTHTLPATQSGSYTAADGGQSQCDLMIARPVTGGAAVSVDVPPLEFIHQCHVMRVQVPVGRNRLGDDIARLRVEFPCEVVGTLTFDLTDPDVQPVLSNGGNTVIAQLSRPLTESEEDDPNGSYVWLFLAPVTVDGAVTFTAYDVNGYQSESISVELHKTLEAGRITPVNLTVPQELPVSWLDLSVVGNQLGEEPYRLTVTAPEGARFRNGTDTMSFDVTEANSYQVGFYDTYDGIANGEAMRAGELTVAYESEHAIVSQKLAVGSFTAGGHTPLSLTVPYLLAENFDTAADRDGSNTTELLDGYGLAAWSGSNYGLSAGTAGRLAAYLGSSIVMDPDSGDNRRGRFDTPLLTGLKEGVEVSLRVSFDVGGTQAEGTSWFGDKKILYAAYEFGTDTRTGAVDYGNGIERTLINGERPGTDGSYTNIPQHKELVIDGCTNLHRLAWRTTYTAEGPSMSVLTAKTVYVYLDNLRVSIEPASTTTKN